MYAPVCGVPTLTIHMASSHTSFMSSVEKSLPPSGPKVSASFHIPLVSFGLSLVCLGLTTHFANGQLNLKLCMDRGLCFPSRFSVPSTPPVWCSLNIDGRRERWMERKRKDKGRSHLPSHIWLWSQSTSRREFLAPCFVPFSFHWSRVLPHPLSSSSPHGPASPFFLALLSCHLW